jgi:hypothetical protein
VCAGKDHLKEIAPRWFQKKQNRTNRMHALTKRSAISPQAALEPEDGYCERIKEKPHGSQGTNS